MRFLTGPQVDNLGAVCHCPPKVSIILSLGENFVSSPVIILLSSSFIYDSFLHHVWISFTSRSGTLGMVPSHSWNVLSSWNTCPGRTPDVHWPEPQKCIDQNPRCALTRRSIDLDCAHAFPCGFRKGFYTSFSEIVHLPYPFPPPDKLSLLILQFTLVLNTGVVICVQFCGLSPSQHLSPTQLTTLSTKPRSFTLVINEEIKMYLPDQTRGYSGIIWRKEIEDSL